MKTITVNGHEVKPSEEINDKPFFWSSSLTEEIEQLPVWEFCFENGEKEICLRKEDVLKVLNGK